MSVPVLPVAAMDDATRDLVSFHLQLDRGDAVVVRHEIEPEPGTPSGRIRRVASSWRGPLFDEWNPLEHCCLNCAARRDIVPTLQRVLADHSPGAIVLVLPLTANPEPLAWELHEAVRDGRLVGAHVAAVLAAADPTVLVDDVFGDDALDERGWGLGATDERSVGEAWCQQLEFADGVVWTEAPDPAPKALLAHLQSATASSTTLADGTERWWTTRHDHDLARARIDPQHWPFAEAADTGDVWSVVLETDRPLHPQRFTDDIEDLGAGELRTRGCFWLASRPECAGAWDGSGGQVSIGDAGLWHDRPRTRLVVTGIDPADRARVVLAFAAMAMTDDELRHLHRWRGRDDLDPWLGEYPFQAAS